MPAPGRDQPGDLLRILNSRFNPGLHRGSDPQGIADLAPTVEIAALSVTKMQTRWKIYFL